MEFPQDMSNELVKFIQAWPVIHKSPYGFSYYNSTNITWSYKPDTSLRVADHWNFKCKGKYHCVTDIPVPNNTHWVIARYNHKTRKYIVEKIIDKKFAG
jgi:hypothetical protein